jgi:hypothetical protein
VQKNLQFPRFLEFTHVALAFERAPGREEDIFVIPIYVLRPICEPRHGLIVNNALPLSRHVGYGNWGALTDVKSNILRADTKLSAV